MGVAGLFSFLRREYPLIVEPCAQQAPTEPLPAGQEPSSLCDNLYIDMNHIIHACTHPGWRDVPHESKEETLQEMEIYLNRLVGIARPQRLVFIAMDGVAPQAKMSQQRGRRFYAAHIEEMREGIEAQVRREMSSQMEAGRGCSGTAAAAAAGAPAASCPPPYAPGAAAPVPEDGDHAAPSIPPLPCFNGNVITPGTSFMARLSTHLRGYVARQLREAPDWRGVAVLLSDSSEAGEGEHKIMRFIRHQRTHPAYPPNTRHCIYGQDADLILLGLLCHEPHFTILRESEAMQMEASTANDGVAGAQGAALGEGEAGDDVAADVDTLPFTSRVGDQPIHLLRVSTLREHLRREFADFVETPAEGGEVGEVDLVTGQRRVPNPNHGGQRLPAPHPLPGHLRPPLRPQDADQQVQGAAQLQQARRRGARVPGVGGPD